MRLTEYETIRGVFWLFVNTHPGGSHDIVAVKRRPMLGMFIVLVAYESSRAELRLYRHNFAPHLVAQTKGTRNMLGAGDFAHLNIRHSRALPVGGVYHRLRLDMTYTMSAPTRRVIESAHRVCSGGGIGGYTETEAAKY